MSSSKTVMIVDDDSDVLAITRRGLELNGFGVHAFSDAIAALSHVEESCKDCGMLVSDIRMPQMNGFQLVRRIKELRPDMKIILMTAFEINKSELESVLPSTPVNDLIRKPFSPSHLAEIIKQVYAEAVKDPADRDGP
ncbi:MAG: response regulator [Nitrososphaera sp.]